MSEHKYTSSGSCAQRLEGLGTRPTRRLMRVAGVGLLAGVSFLGNPANGMTEDFESFGLGTVNLQGGWTVQDSFGNGVVAYDQEVVDDGSGNQVFRLSNAVTSTNFSNQPFSHLAPFPAGESGSSLWNDFGGDHTMPLSPPDPGTAVGSEKFHASFRFRSATGAAQPDLSLNISPSAKQSNWRNSYILIDDNGTGLDVSLYGTDISGAPFGNFPSPISAPNLSYDAWHTVELFIGFVDGVNGVHPNATGNDVVTLLVDGVVVATDTTWESFYHGSNPGAGLGAPPHRMAVDSLMFRSSGTAQPGNSGNGLFFDDVTIDNAMFMTTPPVPEPLTPALMAMGAVALLRRRR